VGAGVVSHATVLFTDLVGSTATRARLGEEIADELRRVHDELLTSAIEGHSGVVVKGLGDGLMARFSSTADAVSAAVAIQQAVDAHSTRHRGHAFEVRIGISAGDVSVEDDDLFGTPVVEAARLCGAAAGGQILAAQVIEVLARGRGEHRFSPVGDLELQGLVGPVPTVGVGWDPKAAGGVVGLPAGLSTAGAFPFSGRDGLMAELVGCWKRSSVDEPGIVLLAGEAGAGKTRLAAELAGRVRDQGGRVLYGHCDETLGTPFLAVIEVLRGAMAASPEARPVELLGPAAGQLSRLLPELLTRDPALEVPEPEDPETDRYRTLTAIIDALAHLAEPDGLVVVLDDLHWADRATSQVLRLMARTGVPPGVLVVGTYRDTDVGPHTPFGEVIAALRREAAVTRLAVGGLDRDGLAELLDAASGDDAYLPDERDELASMLWAATEGNPFFAGELLRHLVESGTLTISDGTWQLTVPLEQAGVPEGVRDVVARRLALLGEDVRATLDAAAVVGPRFTSDTVAAVAGTGVDTVLDHLDDAVVAFLVNEEGVGRFRFCHALVRASLYEGLSATRRCRMHVAVAGHLEAHHPGDVEALSHHWFQAAPTGPDAAERAIDHAVAAGEAAMGTHAPDTAVDYFERALAVAEDTGSRDDAWRAKALFGLGVARRVAGRGEYRLVLEEAAGAALGAGHVEVAAEALLADRGLLMTMGDITADRRALEEAVIEAADALPVPMQVRILALRAGDAALCRDVAYRDRATDEAWAAAAGLDSQQHPQALAEALSRLPFSAYGSLRFELHAAVVDRLAEAAEMVSGRAQLLADHMLATAQLQLGRLDDALVHAERMLRTADDLREPFVRALPLFDLAWVHLVRGDVAEATSVLHRYEALSAAADDPDLAMWGGAIRVGLAFIQGTLGELAAQALERAFPMRVLRYRLRTGSGGAGRFRGGEGIERDLLFLEDVTVSLITERRVSRPWGLQGGRAGREPVRTGSCPGATNVWPSACPTRSRSASRPGTCSAC
jgi:class 3 adenylate cyclase/tetratricopeptide (TPR) repeat protein